MRVRFQGNVRRSSAGPVTGLFQRSGLGMFYLFEEVEALADDLTGGIYDQCSHQRTGTNLSGALRRQLERASHHSAICVSPLFHDFSKPQSGAMFIARAWINSERSVGARCTSADKGGERGVS